MIAALMEGIAFVASLASISLLCGLMRAAKVYSQVTEDQAPESIDENAAEDQASAGASTPPAPLRNVS